MCGEHNGKYMGSSSTIALNDVTNVVVLEAMASREAWSFGTDCLAKHILTSSDNSSIIKDIESNVGGAHAAVIKEENDRKNDFESCWFIYESRRRNYEADGLPKFSLLMLVGMCGCKSHMILYQFH